MKTIAAKSLTAGITIINRDLACTVASLVERDDVVVIEFAAAKRVNGVLVSAFKTVPSSRRFYVAD